MRKLDSPDSSGGPRVSPRGVFLVGFMGAGKTTVGRDLARRLGWIFIDLDDRIEAREGRKVAEIFAQVGEAGFRAAEAHALNEVLAELRQGSPVVLAVGGGAFVQQQNAQAMRDTRVPVVFLDAPVEELRSRCAPRAATRPLFQDEKRFRELYQERRSSYMQADYCVNTAGRSISAIAKEIVALLQGKES